MKLLHLVLLLAVVTLAFAQSHDQPAPAQPSPQAALSADETRQLEYDLNTLRARFVSFRSEAALVSDSTTRRALLTNADMWEPVIMDMQSRLDHMKASHSSAPHD